MTEDAAVLADCLAWSLERLVSAVDGNWDEQAGDLELSVRQVVAHVAEVCLWYAIDLSAGGADLGPVEHRVEPESPPADLVATLGAYGRILVAVVTTTPDSTRGFHPMGAADPSGFAAMGCDELLIHTDDVCRGLGNPTQPPAALVAAVLARLFPWVDPGEDPWAALRWANGRCALGGAPRLERWAWQCAPLDEWDGAVPGQPR